MGQANYSEPISLEDIEQDDSTEQVEESKEPEKEQEWTQKL